MNSTTNNGPRRRGTGVVHQLKTLMATALPSIARDRRTVTLAVVQLLPVAAALLFVQGLGLDGRHVYTAIVEWAVFPFFVPLVALFYGGPLLVDEIEQKTLSYLTLRPISKPVLYVGKWLSGTLVAVGLAVLPVLLLYPVTTVFGSGGGPGPETLLTSSVATVVAAAAYTAVFATVGIWLAKSVIGGVVYFVLFDFIMGQIPVFKLATVRFHVFNIAQLEQPAGARTLGALINVSEFSVPWGGSVAIASVGTALMVAVGGAIFSVREYEI